MRVQIETECTATVTETWIVDMPDHYDDADILEAFDTGEFELHQVRTSEARGERDRKILDVSVMAT
jgi:hypothetical protein